MSIFQLAGGQTGVITGNIGMVTLRHDGRVLAMPEVSTTIVEASDLAGRDHVGNAALIAAGLAGGEVARRVVPATA
jgi:hypothetical protein